MKSSKDALDIANMSVATEDDGRPLFDGIVIADKIDTLCYDRVSEALTYWADFCKMFAASEEGRERGSQRIVSVLRIVEKHIREGAKTAKEGKL